MIISLASISSEMKSSNYFQITFQPGQVNGEVDCCKTVRFDSTGPLAESEYAFMIGTYEYVADDAGDITGVCVCVCVCVCIDRTLYMQATAFSQLRLLIQKERTISQYF